VVPRSAATQTSQYNVAGAVRLTGQLDRYALGRSLNEILRRHEALRTTFAKVHGQPAQIIALDLDLPLPVTDLSALAPNTRARQLQQRLQEEALLPFDLSQGPLIRARLLRLAEHEHVLILTLHHIVSDGWSIGVLIREFVALYSAFLQGQPSPLPELAIQYADFAHWQRGWLSGAVLEEHLSYWREQLAGAPELLLLPTDRPRPPTITFNGATSSFSLSAHCLAALNALAQRHNATLFMALTAAFQLLLARYSGQDDICIGTPIANRNRPEIEPLIGCFVNTLVLRTRLDGRQSFEQLLEQVRATALAAYAHQDLPFETLVDALNPQRRLNHTPLVQVTFVLQNLPIDVVELPGLTSEPFPVPAIAAKFDLTLEMSEAPEGLRASLSYNTDLFDASSIERLIGHFSQLLQGIATNPDQKLANLDMLAPEERALLLCGFNRPIPPLPEGLELPQGLAPEQISALQVLAPDRQLSPIGATGQLYLADSAGQLFPTSVRARWLTNGEIEYPIALPQTRNDAEPAVYVEPRTATERALADLWQEILDLPQIGIHDNFFHIGGQSLLAVTVLSEIEARLGIPLAVETLFKSPTIAELADTLSHATARQLTAPPNLIPPGCEAITPQMLPLISLSDQDIECIASQVAGGMSNIQDIYPLVPLQEGVLFHHLMSQEGDPYLMPALLAFDTRTRLDAFLEAMQHVIQRHDILRTAVLWQGVPTPLQIVWRDADLPVEQVEIPLHADCAAELTRRFDPGHYRLDVRRAPLMHAFIAQDPAKSRWLLRLLFHHLAVDHVTIFLVLQEIRSLLEGHPEQLPTSLPFRDFVVRARGAMSQDEHDAFFRTMLADVTEPTAAFGLLEVRGDGAAIAEARKPVAPHVAHALRRQARRLGVSAASLVHLAWAQVLARTSGRNDVVFGTVLLGRMQGGQGVERVLGIFVNTLPVRLHPDVGSIEQRVRDTHALLTELMRHEQASLVHAQRCSAVAAPAPLFTALLNYRYSETDPLQQQGWEGVTLLSGEERTNYPITVSVDDMGEGFSLTAQVCKPLSPERLCTYLHTALEHLAHALEHRPDLPVQDIEILPTLERDQLLCGFDLPIPPLPEGFELPQGLAPEQIAALRVLAPDLQLSPIGALGELYLADCAGQLFCTGVRARWLTNGEIEYLLAPQQTRNGAEPAVYVEPRTATERALVDLWQEILGLPRVGIHDNFFQIGGQSLLAVTVLSQIEVRLDTSLTVAMLFESPTIAQLAKIVDDHSPPAAVSMPGDAGTTSMTRLVI
jgi:non-ribosomal peptide synthetase component F